MHKVLLATAIVFGIAIAYVDSRPRWDDTGITAMAVLFTSATISAIGRDRPWLWALAVGSWIPLWGVIHSRNFGSFLALGFAFAGAYAGMAFRKTLSAPQI
jgi:hypothetical protein